MENKTVNKQGEQYASFNFVRFFAPKVAEDLNLAEDYLHIWNDPHGSMLKVRAAIEDLVANHIVVRELPMNQSAPKPSFQECIELLGKKGTIPKKVIQSMEYIRKRGNRANHERWDKLYDARECLKQAYKILSYWETVSLFGGQNNN